MIIECQKSQKSWHPKEPKHSNSELINETEQHPNLQYGTPVFALSYTMISAKTSFVLLRLVPCWLSGFRYIIMWSSGNRNFNSIMFNNSYCITVH